MRDSVIFTPTQRDTLLSQLFGEESNLYTYTESGGRYIDIVVEHDSLGYEVMVIVVTLLYIYWLGRYISIHTTNRYRESRRMGFGGVEESGSFFLDTTLPWGLFISLTAILSSRIGIIFSIDKITSIPFWMLMYGVMSIFTLYWLWGWIVMKIWNKDEQSEELCDNLIAIKVRAVLISTIYLLPMALLSSTPNSYPPFSYLLFVSSLGVTIHYFIKIFSLFMHEKVSTFRWFLYLCTVEVAPLVLGWFIFDYLTTK
ncbi:MAG: DUF4271 domain-containing protein [Rikenellaceae bacterium]